MLLAGGTRSIGAKTIRGHWCAAGIFLSLLLDTCQRWSSIYLCVSLWSPLAVHSSFNVRAMHRSSYYGEGSAYLEKLCVLTVAYGRAR